MVKYGVKWQQSDDSFGFETLKDTFKQAQKWIASEIKSYPLELDGTEFRIFKVIMEEVNVE